LPIGDEAMDEGEVLDTLSGISQKNMHTIWLKQTKNFLQNFKISNLRYYFKKFREKNHEIYPCFRGINFKL